MSAPLWSQLDAGVALTVGSIVEVAAIRKLQQPRVFALSLQRLEPSWAGRHARTRRLTYLVAGFEAVVAAGVVVFRGTPGFVFAGALLVACAGFVLALVRAIQQSVPCACFGRLGRTAAGGREIGRALVLLSGAAFLVVHRALAASLSHGVGPYALVAASAMIGLIVVAQWIGTRLRPGAEARVALDVDRPQLAGALRQIVGIDNDLYSKM